MLLAFAPQHHLVTITSATIDADIDLALCFDYLLALAFSTAAVHPKIQQVLPVDPRLTRTDLAT